MVRTPLRTHTPETRKVVLIGDILSTVTPLPIVDPKKKTNKLSNKNHTPKDFLHIN